MANIRHNLAYSALLTMSTYVVPLILFPYISRVLGIENIGRIDTIDNLMDYCILFSMMGLTSVGIREIAKNKDNPETLGQTFTDLFALNLYSTLLIAIVFGVAVWLSPRLQDYGVLIPIGICKLIANLFWIEWLYTGLEDFRYITLRSLVLRTLFVISVFLLVRTQSDAAVYYALFVGITVGNAICNWYHKRTYLHWNLRQAHLRRYLVPFIMLGLFAMLSAFYTKLSLPVLSFLTDDHEAGSYATATRVFQVIIALVSALAGVMIPRMSVLMKEGQFDQVRAYTSTSFKMLFLFAAPIICYTEIYAPDIIRIFAGSGFDDAYANCNVTVDRHWSRADHRAPAADTLSQRPCHCQGWYPGCGGMGGADSTAGARLAQHRHLYRVDCRRTDGTDCGHYRDESFAPSDVPFPTLFPVVPLCHPLRAGRTAGGLAHVTTRCPPHRRRLSVCGICPAA